MGIDEQPRACYDGIESCRGVSLSGDSGMTRKINGQVYHRTLEACREVGISRATLFRWLKAGILEATYRDRNGWHIFTTNDLKKLKAESNKVRVEQTSR